MAEAVDVRKGLGGSEPQTILRRFRALNQDRLQRALEGMRPRQQDAVHLLPLLFHTNHPSLPGYVNADTPAGICGFTPGREQLGLAKRLGQSFEYRRLALRRYPIQGLYAMGSVGTIGHSRSSDLDFWLCHQPGLSEQTLQDLALKAQKLEQWAADLDLEMHFFLMNVPEFRAGKVSELSGESSGSTQHGLLLEEFYRSGLLLAGRYPLWWLVPPEQERNYTACAEELIHKRLVDSSDVLDFGGLGNIQENEFIGAGLWQLFKGVHSPYKSLLKILLMETYAQAFPDPDWLSLKIKQAVYAGNKDLEHLDAYLQMYRLVEAYLLQRKQPERLELARRCLYFKVNETLSRSTSKTDWRGRKMLELTREWGWSQHQLKDLDNRPQWKIDRVSRERDQLVRELTRSYRLLSDFAAWHEAELRINPEELDVIGRKLYTALEQRPGKVERVNPGISKDLAESELSLRFEQRGGEAGWCLYPGRIDADTKRDPVRETGSLIELLAWCRINGLSDANTHFVVQEGHCPVTVRELSHIVHTLHEALPPTTGSNTPLTRLAQRPYPKTLLGFVNVGEDPQYRLTRDGKLLVSGRADPLSYGAERRCLLVSLDLLVETSWGELVAHHYQKPEGLLDGLCFYLDLRRRIPADAEEPTLDIAGYATPDAIALARRVEEVFQVADRYFREHPQGRYLIGLGSRYFLIEATDRGFHWLRQETTDELLESLGEPRARYSPPACDPQTLKDSPLPAIFRCCRPGEQQLFYLCAKGHTRLFALDENGSLFHQEFPVDDPRFLLVQQQRFLESLARLRRLSGVTEEAISLITGPRFYRLEHNSEQGWRAQPVRLPRSRIGDYLELRLIAESSGQDIRVLRLVCGEREFPASRHGAHLFAEVVELIMSYRKGGDYPIYLTEVELIQDRYGVPPNGVELLQLKRRVEHRLNLCMRDYLANSNH